MLVARAMPSLSLPASCRAARAVEVDAKTGDLGGQCGVLRRLHAREQGGPVGADGHRREGHDGADGPVDDLGVGARQQIDELVGLAATTLEAGELEVVELGRGLAAGVGLAGGDVQSGPGGGASVEEDAHALAGGDGVGASRRREGGAQLVGAGAVPGARELDGAAAAALARGARSGDEAPADGEDEDEGRGGEQAAAARGVVVAGELGEEREEAGVAVLRRGREAAEDGAAQPGRDLVVARRLADQAPQHVAGEAAQVVAVEGALPVERLVEGDAEGELVGAGVGAAAEVLLGGHVERRAHDGAGDREVDLEAGVGGGDRDVLLDRLHRAGRASQAEVHDAGAAAAVDEHVLGLEVAVDDAGLVRGLQATPGLQEDLEDRPPVARSGEQPVREGAALDELEGEEDLTRVGADLVDLQHVGVGDLGHRLGLAEQAAVADGLRPADDALVQQLDGDLAVEVGVVGGVDDPHAAGADRLEHRIAADLSRRLALPGRGGCSGRGQRGRAQARGVLERHAGRR